MSQEEHPARISITPTNNIRLEIAGRLYLEMAPEHAIHLGKALMAKALAASGETGTLVTTVIPR